MDDILSPKRAAKVKATCGKPPDQSDTDDSGEEQESDTDDTEEDAEEDTEEDTEEDMKEESSENQENSQASDHAPSPGCRRSSRKLSNKSVPNYDVRYVTFPLLIVVCGHHSIVDNIVIGFIRLLIRLCVQLLPGLR